MDDDTDSSPSAADITAWREAIGATKATAAAAACTSWRTWQRWETGERAMPAAVWLLVRARLLLAAGMRAQALALLAMPHQSAAAERTSTARPARHRAD